MTHLYIEQNNSVTEEVNMSIISKMYELASSGDLDNTSDLKGRLHSTSAKENHVTYLTQHYPDLYINADKLYISFADPEVDRVLTSVWGDGTGLLMADVNTKTVLFPYQFGFVNPFENNKTITSFDELGRFTSIKELYKGIFNGASNLLSIDLSNIEIVGCDAFNGTAIRTLNLPNITGFKNHLGSLLAGAGRHFCNCSSLTQATIGPNLQYYTTGEWFKGCSNLLTLTILSSIDELPGSMCKGCSSLKTLNLDWDSVTYKINDECFYGCSNLEINDLSISPLTIGDRAFIYCSKLTGKLTLGLILTIGTNVFQGCTGITEVEFDTGNTGGGNSMFYQCTGLLTVSGLSNMITLNNYMFGQCSNLESVDISSSNLKYIGSACFSRCSKLNITTLNLPNLEDYTDYLDRSFEYCTKLTHVTNLGKITKLKGLLGNYGTFFNCGNLEDVTFPETLEEIGMGLLSGCTRMRWVKFTSPQMVVYNLTHASGTPQSYGRSFGESWANDNPTSGTYRGQTYPIYVPDALLSQYQAADGWKYVGPNRLKPLSQFATDFPNG